MFSMMWVLEGRLLVFSWVMKVLLSLLVGRLVKEMCNCMLVFVLVDCYSDWVRLVSLSMVLRLGVWNCCVVEFCRLMSGMFLWIILLVIMLVWWNFLNSLFICVLLWGIVGMVGVMRLGWVVVMFGKCCWI